MLVANILFSEVDILLTNKHYQKRTVFLYIS